MTVHTDVPKTRTKGRLIRPINRWIVEALVIVLIGSLTYFAVTGIQSANRANCCFPLALMQLPPGSQPEPNYLSLTAMELNHTQPQRPYFPLRVRFVSSNVSSTSPTVISVNPINPFTWAAVALGTDRHCYATLSALDPSHSAYGQMYYARFPIGVPCRGNEATSETVTLTQLPEGLS
jgi:hypothetical protein